MKLLLIAFVCLAAANALPPTGKLIRVQQGGIIVKDLTGGSRIQIVPKIGTSNVGKIGVLGAVDVILVPGGVMVKVPVQQLNLLGQILIGYQGVINDLVYGNLLAQIQGAGLDPVIVDVLSSLSIAGGLGGGLSGGLIGLSGGLNRLSGPLSGGVSLGSSVSGLSGLGELNTDIGLSGGLSGGVSSLGGLSNLLGSKQTLVTKNLIDVSGNGKRVTIVQPQGIIQDIKILLSSSNDVGVVLTVPGDAGSVQILGQILGESQGIVSESNFQNILNQIQLAVVNGQIPSIILQVLQGLNLDGIWNAIVIQGTPIASVLSGVIPAGASLPNSVVLDALLNAPVGLNSQIGLSGKMIQGSSVIDPLVLKSTIGGSALGQILGKGQWSPQGLTNLQSPQNGLIAGGSQVVEIPQLLGSPVVPITGPLVNNGVGVPNLIL